MFSVIGVKSCISKSTITILNHFLDLICNGFCFPAMNHKLLILLTGNNFCSHQRLPAANLQESGST